ncbi:hypothetical protein L484_026643 [Morus notabilis]|uniref:DUF4220 domain-containing protein n=1 Tax=Morus notabilis TaxID=981085 RepID=W9SCV0_9ROSA|nr:uncharacterized protein LOC21409289 [Morus notabilis]EXC35319.1 hypothetical protein L484_026643 [Morus notabilis]
MGFEYTELIHDMSVAPQAPYVFKKRESYRTKLIRIEAYVGVTSILLVFLVLFGSFRRRSRSSAVKYLTWIAYFLSTKLITYTLGQMQSTTFYDEMFAVWAVFMGVVLSNSDAISAYSLEDNEHRKRYNLEMLVQSFWVGYLIGECINSTELMIQLYIVWFLSLGRAGERIEALMSASKDGLAEHSKLVSDYMWDEHALSKDDHAVDPVSMKGYNYLVTGENENRVNHVLPLYRKKLDITVDEVVTVHKIWECKGSLLSSRNDPNNRLKDICLSFALCRLLRRRFGRYLLHESCQDKTWNFVRYGLLSESGDDDHDERAFRVVEVELAFLYDSLYTKYPALFANGFPKLRPFVSLLIVVLGCWIVGSFLHRYNTPYGYRSLTFGRFNCDVLLTYLVIFTFLFIEVMQLVFIFSSDWAKVLFVCKYVAKPSWRTKRIVEKILGFVCHSRSWLNSQPWERKLGQYDLIKHFDHDPCKLINNWFVSPYKDLKRKGEKENKRIKLTTEVKKAVVLSFKTNGRKLSNGLASLQRNGFADQFSWACRLETQTHVVLVWHIATTLCEKSLSFSQTEISAAKSKYFNVANALSKYCAYLVAFKPRLLPDHAYTTEFIFSRVVYEARDLLKGCKTSESKCRKMMKLGHEGDRENEIIKRGAVLGKQLIDETENWEQLWKVLSEFWAEMMLFVAPSDDVTAHAENLATGGEFVTHLWALLTNAGILNRSEQAVDHLDA